MATGNWGLKMNVNKQGVSQVLNRLTFAATVSHLRRVQTPSDNTGKLIPPRKLHGTSWGYVCPSETPEGGSVGLVKNLSLGCYVTIGSSIDPVLKILNENSMIPLEDILDIKGRRKKNGQFYRRDLKVHVLWKGYPIEEATWEPYNELKGNNKFYDFCKEKNYMDLIDHRLFSDD